MNLYEFEGKQLFSKYGIATPKGVVVRRGEDVRAKYSAFAKATADKEELGIKDVVVKAQVLSGKRGKNNGIKFCSNVDEVARACDELFAMNIRGQYVAAVLIEEKLDIAEEHYLSITYNTNQKQPVMVYSREGGMDIEEAHPETISKYSLDITFDINQNVLPIFSRETQGSFSIDDSVTPLRFIKDNEHVAFFKELWNCFVHEDARLVEINPLVKTRDGRWVAADAKVALDDDAFYRHEEWKNLEPRTMLGRLPTERELEVKKIDEGENYYRGTAGKYIEMDGDIAILFSGGGASISNMDALIKAGCKPANYTEYSGNPPREKVYQLAKIVLSKPGLKGLWIAGGVANFTNIGETFHGIVDALDEIKPTYPIVVRRAGPHEEEGMRLMRECGERNGLHMKLFGKDMSMSESAKVLADTVQSPATTSTH